VIIKSTPGRRHEFDYFFGDIVYQQQKMYPRKKRSEAGTNSLVNGYSMVARWFYFLTKNRNFDLFWKALQWEIVVNFMAIWYIL
jgi:hypothetical protein